MVQDKILTLHRRIKPADLRSASPIKLRSQKLSLSPLLKNESLPGNNPRKQNLAYRIHL
ncbi:hypothetical protein M758_10G093400 [Ceratodon purpureus]|nr:hypothetical protein M758_10G093400 [Ceratodon purpureus]